jgi:hypothetical protein
MTAQWKAAEKVPATLERFGLGAEPVWSESDRVWYAKSGSQWMQHPGVSGPASAPNLVPPVNRAPNRVTRVSTTPHGRQVVLTPMTQLLPRYYAEEEGLGALPDPLSTATYDLAQYLNTNGCSQAVLSQVSSFQQAFNDAGYTPQIQVDGQYGPCTQTALQTALDAGGAGGLAPASCFSGTCSNGQYVAPQTPGTPGGGGGTTPTVNPSPVSTNPSPLLVGAVAVAVGVVGYAGYRYYKRRKSHKKS